MRKALLLTGIIAWSLVLVIIALVLFANFKHGGWQDYGNAALLKEEQLSLPAGVCLVIETNATDIELLAGTGEQLLLRQYGSADAPSGQLFSVTVEGERVTVRLKHKWRFAFGLHTQERLEVEIPQSWLGDIEARASSGRMRLNDAFTWQDTSLSTSSGSIVINRELTTANLRLNSNSGNIRALATLNVAESLNVDASSGNIHLEAPLSARELYGNVNSGSIRLAEAMVQKFELKASSGNIRVAGLSGDGSVRANSGSIDVALLEPQGAIDMRASSGTIRLSVPRHLSFSFVGRCSSGTVKADFPLIEEVKDKFFSGSVGDNPSVSINAEVNSGSISIDRQ